ERDRGAARGDASPRVPRSRHRGERAAPPGDPVRLRPVLQRGPAAPGAGAGHPAAAGPPTRWRGPLPAGARWAAPRVRACGLTAAEVLPLDTLQRGGGAGTRSSRAMIATVGAACT